jgi:hypothetical protein
MSNQEDSIHSAPRFPYLNTPIRLMDNGHRSTNHATDIVGWPFHCNENEAKKEKMNN